MSAEEDKPAKRFKHQSYSQSLKEVHLPSAFNQTQYQQDISDDQSQFHQALEHWKQLNLAPAFIRFANHVEPLSLSMPLLLHHWKDVVSFWEEAMEASDDEGLRPLLDLMQKLAHDLRTTLLPVYPSVLKCLLKLFPRTLAATALTVLLEMLSALFRYLIVPSAHTESIDYSWNAIQSVLPKCLPEVQRAVAEVWGSVLRRLKTAARERAVSLLAQSAEGLEEVSAWTIVYACKSISQTLHTSTVSIFVPLITHHISTTNPGATYTVIRRSMTALIHHVRNAEQYAVLGDLLIGETSKAVNEYNTADAQQVEKLRRLLEVISIPYSVRQGSRMSQTHHTGLFALLDSIPMDNAVYPALLKLVAGLFVASDTSLWLGLGLKFLQRLWSSSNDPLTLEFTLKLHGILADMNWGGWKLVALPLLVKGTRRPDTLVVDHALILELLASLHRAKTLNVDEVDLVWRENVEKWLLERLQNWSPNGGDTAVLENILTLASFMHGEFTTMLLKMVDRELDSSEGNGTLESLGFTMPGWLLGRCMRSLQKRPQSEWIKHVDLRKWARVGLKKYPTSPEVIDGLVELARTSPSTNTVSFDEIYPVLSVSILSHSRIIRLNALRLMDTHLVPLPGGVQEVLKRCLQGEEVSLDVQGVRERVLRIGRVVQIVGDPQGAELCTRWLLAQLKVNLRPLWSPACAALSTLSERFGDTVWKLIFAEIMGFSSDNHVSRHTEPGQANEENSDTWEEERSWRDPSAHQLHITVARWLDPQYKIKELVKESQSGERFDPQAYEHHLLMALGECHTLAEKYNRDIVSHFLFLVSEDGITRPSKQKLSGWLTLFSKFNNPKALYSTDRLRSFYISHLSHPDRTTQSLSLRCLFTYKSPHLVNHEDQIRLLLDDTRWRDELTLLEIGNVDPGDRHEVVDVIIRLLFGLMLERRGHTKGGDRRAAVLAALAGCSDDELGLLVDLMLKQLNSNRYARAASPFAIQPVPSSTTDKQLVGYLTLLGDVLKGLGSRLVSYWPALLGSTIDIISNVQTRLSISNDDSNELPGEERASTDILNDNGEGEAAIPTTPSKIIRSIRQLGLKRLADFFRCPASFDFTPYLSSTFEYCVLPRLGFLDRENTQAPSALLELFYAWTLRSEHTFYLVQYSSELLPKVYDCLIATNVKPSVILRVFDITENILFHSSTDEQVRDIVLRPHVSRLLNNLSALMETVKDIAAVSTPLGQRQISILSEVAQYLEDNAQATTLLILFIPLLRKPSKFVSEKVKVDLLKILGDLMCLIPDLRNEQAGIYQKTYELLSQLFQSLRSRASRVSLVHTFKQLASLSDMESLAVLLEDLNAYSTKRIDEPDFDRRLNAFSRLNESLFRTLSATGWVPVLHECLYCIQDAVELVMRNNASFAMKHFIDIVATRSSDEHEKVFIRLLWPGLKNGLRSKNELVRAEVLGTIAHAVVKCKYMSNLKEMQVLLEGGDEEANFFNNILHVQLHRRSRALRRLGDHCDEGHLRSSALADIFVPLVGNYIASTASIDHHLVNDAIVATGRMAKCLNWSSYHSLVQKYVRLSKAKDESERIYVRALVAILDSFHFPMDDMVHDTVDGDMDEETELDTEVKEADTDKTPNKMARIADTVNLRLLPTLLNYLEKYDATTNDNARIPVSIGIMTVVQHLPEGTREPQIARLLTILGHILRSRSQETRDFAKEALVRISINLGPKYLPLVFKELRGALTRGPQLHVLAFVTHAILVQVASPKHTETFNILDDCADDIAHISAEVIFGESGKDLLSEDFKTKMREVRGSSSRALDSFTIISKFVTPNKISTLLTPARTIMQETESMKVIQLVDEVLKRIASGLNSNKHLVPLELIVLCHTLINQNAKFLKQTAARKKSTPKSEAIVQLKRDVGAETDHYANNSFRFITFGLDLFNAALRRSRFDFHNPEVIKRLESMVVVIGNALYSTNTSVVNLGLKCAAGLTKCPLKNLPKTVPVFIDQMIDIIRKTGNTEAEIVQIAFKTLASILRDFPAAQVKEKDLIFLLELLSPDLEEHERQGAVFTMLRAIVARKFIVPEIYDIMGKVSEVMVTSQSPQVQELCRGVLLQFLLDYPQGKGRLRNQMTFLAKNLSYIYESGRTSVMELLGAIINKFQDGLIYEYTDLLFVGLVMVIANDDAAKCREMAAHLIKNLYVRVDNERRKMIFSHLHTWAVQESQPQLVWVSSQIYGFIIDAAGKDIRPLSSMIMDDLRVALLTSTSTFTGIEDSQPDAMEIDLEWRIPYHSLTALSKVLGVFPDFATDDEKMPWSLITVHLLYPHAWVRTAACRVLGLLFSTVPVAAPRTDKSDDHPLSFPGMQEAAKKFCSQLKSENLDEALSLQVVKNMFFIGKCFYAMPKPVSPSGGQLTDEMLDDTVDDRNARENEQIHDPLPWLFSKLSYQIKSAHITRRNRSNNSETWHLQPLAALRWFAAMASYMDPERVEFFLVHVLTPIYRLTEDDTIRDAQMEELKTTAIELQDLVQAKVGTTKFTPVYNQIRQKVLELRQNRKVARSFQATTNPEYAAKRRLQRNTIKKESRKRKERSFAERRGKLKKRKNE